MSGTEPLAILGITEQNLLRVPFEKLKRAAKDRKAVLDDAQEGFATLRKEQLGPAGTHSQSRESQLESMDKLISHLQGLKRKLIDVSGAENQSATQCKARLSHLQQLTVPMDSMVAWNRQRLDCLLVDHLQRSGYHQSAQLLCSKAGVQDLVDSDVYEDAGKVVAALRRQDCNAALAWCLENKGKLKKLKSALEFKLRTQEFLEMVKQDRRMEAVQYAQQYLAPWASTHMGELQQAMATLAFSPLCPNCPPVYLQLHQPSRWEDLVTLFKQELYRLHGLPADSQLISQLRVGLSALKTPASYQLGCNREDPLSLPAMQQLATGLPHAKHVHSKLLCSVMNKLMSDENPAMVLPNGYVYSQEAVDVISAANDGRMVCPQTGKVFALDELRRAFIV